MCTVSFLPNRNGFHLTMNRDEKRSRLTALPPETIDLGERRTIFPREPDGGTWIAANESGVCLALINWHRIEREPANGIVSRGKIVRELAAKSSTGEVANGLTNLPLDNIRPFRLLAIVPHEKIVSEWRWNLGRLTLRRHPWKRQHWFSSGLDEAKAERERRRVCERLRPSSASIANLRRLHRSHAPKRGPFSICMHRDKAATVSYTEVSVSDRDVVMRYKEGPPCSRRSIMTKSCKLSRASTTSRR
jgi:hypothetical protein